MISLSSHNPFLGRNDASRANPLLKWFRCICLLSSIVYLAGCSSKDQESKPSLKTPRAAASTKPAATKPTSGFRIPDSTSGTWELITVGGSPVGFAVTTNTSVQAGLETVKQSQRQEQLRIARAGQIAEVTSTTITTESPEGQLLTYEKTDQLGPTPTVTKGNVQDGQLSLVIHAGDRQETISLEFPEGTAGPFAVEQLLLRNPMQPGETRNISQLLPGVNAAAQVQLKAKELEEVHLLGASKTLLKIESSINLPGINLSTLIWTNPAGEIEKTTVPAAQIVAFRSSRSEVVKILADAPKFIMPAASTKTASGDLIQSSSVKLKAPLPTARPQKAKYLVTLKSGQQPADIFWQGLSQQIVPRASNSAEITVLSIRPNQPASLATAQPMPEPSTMAPNNFIQSDHPLILEIVSQIAPEELNTWNWAVAAEKWVHREVQEKNYTQAMASAADVARTREGDCTEHAVLLAALLRARQIPARVAVGLVYVPSGQAFEYHMWTEAWIQDRWIPLDATRGHGGIGAWHIKLADSALSADTAARINLQAAQVIGQIEIEALEIDSN